MDFRKVLVGSVLACGSTLWAAPGSASPGPEAAGAVERLAAQNKSLVAELQQMKARLDRVEAERGEAWLDERRAEEVKALITDVLSDADTRASLLDEGITAGHDGKHFFLKSPDGSFLMEIAGHMQMRYVANFADNPWIDKIDASGDEPEPGEDGKDDEVLDEGEAGFTLRRTKLSFSGHVTANPQIDYKIVLAAEREGGDWLTEDFEIGHKFANGVKVKAGQMKLPFLREELVSSSKQLAVDRGSATEYFTLDRGQGVALSYGTDTIKVQGMVSDGADNESTDWAGDGTDIALTGRVDAKLAGNWKQAGDFAAWSGEGFAAFVGAAAHWQQSETGTSGANDAIFLWTADGLVEFSGVGLMAAVMGLSTANEMGADFDDLGVQLEAGVFVIPDKLQPFVRYDYIDVDGAGEMNLVTAGVNYYLNKHDAKFTVDVVYALDPLFDTSRNFNDPASSGLGLRDDVDGQDGQTALRAQFQLKF